MKPIKSDAMAIIQRKAMESVIYNVKSAAFSQHFRYEVTLRCLVSNARLGLAHARTRMPENEILHISLFRLAKSHKKLRTQNRGRYSQNGLAVSKFTKTDNGKMLVISEMPHYVTKCVRVDEGE